MHKYIADVRNKLKALKDGIAANPGDWTGMPYDVSSVQTDIDELDVISHEISNLAAQLLSKQQAARKLVSQKKLKTEGIVNMVKSIYSTNNAKWLEYGVRPITKSAGKVLSKELNLDIADNKDGEGFLLWVQNPDSNAKSYFWERGVSDDPSNRSVIPEMKYFHNSTRSKITDNDVLPGKRYFYRVRAFNNKGYGPWSDFVSKVQ